MMPSAPLIHAELRFEDDWQERVHRVLAAGSKWLSIEKDGKDSNSLRICVCDTGESLDIRRRQVGPASMALMTPTPILVVVMMALCKHYAATVYDPQGNAVGWNEVNSSLLSSRGKDDTAWCDAMDAAAAFGLVLPRLKLRADAMSRSAIF